MKTNNIISLTGVAVFMYFFVACGPNTKSDPKAVDLISGKADPLPSWNEGATKNAITDYVSDVTNAGSNNFIAVPDRIATFDNDGNLWSE